MNWKRIALTGVITTLLSTVHGFPHHEASAAVNREIHVNIDDEQVTLAASSYLEQGTVMVPITMLHKLSEAQINWNNADKTATVRMNGQSFALKPGAAKVSYAGKVYNLNKKVQLINHRIMVPAAFLSEISDTDMRFDKMDRILYLITDRYYIMTVPKHEEIQLQATQLNQYDYVEGMNLIVNGDSHPFTSWEGMWNWRYKPVIHVEDLTNDGREEFAVINTLGYGTGLMQKEVHIINLQNHKEFPIESFEDITKEWIDSSITTQDGKVTASVKIKGEEEIKHVLEEYKGLPPDYFYSELGFGAVVYYFIDNGKLTARLGASASTVTFSGDVFIEYKYEDGRFLADKVSYAPHQK